jgi:hypothetical protein
MICALGTGEPIQVDGSEGQILAYVKEVCRAPEYVELQFVMRRRISRKRRAQQELVLWRKDGAAYRNRTDT